MEFLSQPWPWYIAGPLAGLTVPLLLIFAGRQLGIAMIFKAACSAVVKDRFKYFNYNWKADSWRFIFILGVSIGGFLGGVVLKDPEPIQVKKATIVELQKLQVVGDGPVEEEFKYILPPSLFSADNAFSITAILFLTIGGFLVGFGSRYADGCTSGHAIVGLSNLQPASLIAVMGFFLGGLLMVHFIFPSIVGWFLLQ